MSATLESTERTARRRPMGAGASAPSGRSRNTAQAAIGILAVLGGGLLALQLVRSAGEKTAVIMTTRDVPAGAVISREDLRSVEVNAEGVATIPVAEAASVIGKVAAGPLPAGSLVTRSQVGDKPPLEVGQGVLSIPVPQGQVPVGLRADSRVALLIVDAEVVAATNVERVEGRVVDVVDTGDATGLVVVSVQIAEGDALPVAQAAAEGGKVSVLLLPEAGG